MSQTLYCWAESSNRSAWPSRAQILTYCNGRNGKGEFASHTGNAGGTKMANGNSQKFRLSYDGADEVQGRDSAL